MRHATLLYAALAAKLRCDGFSPAVSSRPPLPRPRAASGGAWRRAAVPDRRGSDGRRTVCPARRGDDDAGDARRGAAACEEAIARQDAEDRALTLPKMAFAFAALALVFLGAEAATSADGDETLRRLLRAAQDFDPRAAIDGVAAEVERLGPLGAAYFAAVYVVAEVLALPAVPLTASAGYLFGAVEGTAIVLFSATIAAGVSFLIGRSLLRSWVERVAGESAQFQAIDRAVASEGFKIILLLRLSPIFPFALSNYFYGLTAVEFGPYLAATLLGFAPGTFLYVYSGEVASVAAGAAGDDAAYPWYVYAGFLSVGAFVAAKVTEVATRALEESGGIVADGDD